MRAGRGDRSSFLLFFFFFQFEFLLFLVGVCACARHECSCVYMETEFHPVAQTDLKPVAIS